MKHEWWVYSTCLSTGWLMLECAITKQTAYVKNPSKKEWSEAFRAPSHPYRWYDESRVELS